MRYCIISSPYNVCINICFSADHPYGIPQFKVTYLNWFCSFVWTNISRVFCFEFKPRLLENLFLSIQLVSCTASYLLPKAMCLWSHCRFLLVKCVTLSIGMATHTNITCLPTINCHICIFSPNSKVNLKTMNYVGIIVSQFKHQAMDNYGWYMHITWSVKSV